MKERESDFVGLVILHLILPIGKDTPKEEKTPTPMLHQGKAIPVFELLGRAQSLTAVVVSEPTKCYRRNQEVLLDGGTTPKMQRAPWLLKSGDAGYFARGKIFRSGA